MIKIKAFLSMGMIGAVTFFLLDLLGALLWSDYNPVSMYVSCLTADGAPNLQLTRFLYYTYNVCLLVFSLAICYISWKKYHVLLKIGFAFLLVVTTASLIGNGAFPMTINRILEKQNMIHLIITVSIFIMTAILIYLLAIGFLKQDKQRKLGFFSLFSAILFSIFNLLLLYVILNGINIAGLMQRMSIYTFFIYIFVLSMVFTKEAT